MRRRIIHAPVDLFWQVCATQVFMQSQWNNFWLELRVLATIRERWASKKTFFSFFFFLQKNVKRVSGAEEECPETLHSGTKVWPGKWVLRAAHTCTTFHCKYPLPYHIYTFFLFPFSNFLLRCPKKPEMWSKVIY